MANFYTQANRFSLSLASNSTYTVGDELRCAAAIDNRELACGTVLGFARTEKLPSNKSGDIRAMVEETKVSAVSVEECLYDRMQTALRRHGRHLRVGLSLSGCWDIRLSPS